MLNAIKTAKYTVTAVEIHCPLCSGEVLEPVSGSIFWAVSEIEAGTVTTCENGHELKLPRILQKNSIDTRTA